MFCIRPDKNETANEWNINGEAEYSVLNAVRLQWNLDQYPLCTDMDIGQSQSTKPLLRVDHFS